MHVRQKKIIYDLCSWFPLMTFASTSPPHALQDGTAPFVHARVLRVIGALSAGTGVDVVLVLPVTLLQAPACVRPASMASTVRKVSLKISLISIENVLLFYILFNNSVKAR